MKTEQINVTGGLMLQAWRNQNNKFAFDGGYISINESFNNLEIVWDDINHACIEAQYSEGDSVLKVTATPCPVFPQNEPVNCPHHICQLRITIT